jgi:hypothetical protein
MFSDQHAQSEPTERLPGHTNRISKIISYKYENYQLVPLKKPNQQQD